MRKYLAPLFWAAIAVIFVLVAFGGVLLEAWLEFTPLTVIVFLCVLVPVCGILYALYLRIKEIKKGEENDISQY